jgi:hypothetical protein
MTELISVRPCFIGTPSLPTLRLASCGLGSALKRLALVLLHLVFAHGELLVVDPAVFREVAARHEGATVLVVLERPVFGLVWVRPDGWSRVSFRP